VDDSALLNTYTEALLVLNKLDLGEDASWSALVSERKTIWVSARTGEGMEGLRSRLRDELLQGEEINSETITNERHIIALKQAWHALKRTLEAVNQGAPGEVVSFELDEGLSALAMVIGETTAQDILDKIFSQFCIGK
jgi:tRNA modification GTPase